MFQILNILLAGFGGLLIGRVLNLIIYFYPIYLKLNWRKQCLDYLMLPTNETSSFSFLTQTLDTNSYIIWHVGGLCLISIITAAVTVAIIIRFDFTWTACGGIILSWGLILLSFIDIKDRILPDMINFLLMWIGLCFNIFSLFTPLQSAIIGSIIGYSALWIVAKIFKLITQKDGMGHGDFKMLSMLGSWLGFTNLPSIMVMATFFALSVCLVLIKMKLITRNSQIPFGPFLALGGWLTLVFLDSLPGFSGSPTGSPFTLG